MFARKKERAEISDEEPKFHVRYLGWTETYVPSGPGCTARHVQKIWENAPSERHLRRVVVKLGLGGIWLKGAPGEDANGTSRVNVETRREGETIPDDGEITPVGSGDRKWTSAGEGLGNEGVENKSKSRGEKGHQSQNAKKEKSKDNKNGSTVRHFKMEDVSFCAADKSVNDRIFCWISRCRRDENEVMTEERIVGPLELHAVLCSTVEKAQTMAAVMSRAFQLAYKDWRAERLRENRKQQTRLAPGALRDSETVQSLSNGGKNGSLDSDASSAEADDISNSMIHIEGRLRAQVNISASIQNGADQSEKPVDGNGNVNVRDSSNSCQNSASRLISTSSSSSSLKSSWSQDSYASS